MAITSPRIRIAAALSGRPSRVRPLVSLWHVLVAGGVILYSVSLRSSDQALAAISGLSLNAWSQVASVIFDPYLTCFFLLPLWLIRAAGLVRDQSGLHTFIRCGSRFRWVVRCWRLAVADAARLALLVIVAAASTAVGLDWTPRWSDLTLNPELAGFTAYPITALGLGPIQVTITQAALLSFGFGSYVAVLSSIHLLHQSKLLQYGSVAIIWLGTAGTLHMPTSFPLANIRNALFLHLSAVDYGSLWLGFIAPLWPTLCILAWRAPRLHLRPSAFRDPRLLCGLLPLSLALVGVATSSANTPIGVITETLWGGGQLWRYCVYAVILLAPALLYAAQLSDVLHTSPHAELIRHKSVITWWAARAFRWSSGSAIYLIFIFLLVFIAANAGLGERSTSLPTPDMTLLAYQFIVNGTLQSTFYLTLIFLARWIINTDASPLIIAGAVMAIGVPQLNPAGWIPVMISGLTHAELGWPHLLSITAKLFFAALVGVSTILALFLRASRLTERNL